MRNGNVQFPCEIRRSHVFPGVCNLHKHSIFFSASNWTLCAIFYASKRKTSASLDAMTHSGYISVHVCSHQKTFSLCIASRHFANGTNSSQWIWIPHKFITPHKDRSPHKDRRKINRRSRGTCDYCGDVQGQNMEVHVEYSVM